MLPNLENSSRIHSMLFIVRSGKIWLVSPELRFTLSCLSLITASIKWYYDVGEIKVKPVYWCNRFNDLREQTKEEIGIRHGNEMVTITQIKVKPEY